MNAGTYSRNRHTWLYPDKGDGLPTQGQRCVLWFFPLREFAGRYNDHMTQIVAWFPLEPPDMDY